MKIVKLLGLSVLLLALAFTGCGGGDGGESDTWAFASSSQLDGTWKGTESITKTMQEWGTLWDWDYTASDYEEVFGNMSMKVTSDLIWIFNGGKVTGSEKIVESFSGGKVNTAFPTLVEWWADESVIVNDSNRTMTYNYDNISFTYGESERWIQINQDGKKIKLTGGSLYNTPLDRILTKQ